MALECTKIVLQDCARLLPKIARAVLSNTYASILEDKIHERIFSFHIPSLGANQSLETFLGASPSAHVSRLGLFHQRNNTDRI